MRILVCGSRSLSDKSPEISRYLDQFYKENNIKILITGMAQGADIIAYFWAIDNRIELLQFPADWENLEEQGAVVVTRKDGTQYNRNAGLERNRRMLVQGKPDCVLAFLDKRSRSNGTRHMIRIAREQGVSVEEIIL